MQPDMQARLKMLAERSGTSNAKVVESLLLMDDQAILNQIERAKPLISQRKRDRLDLKHDIAKKLAGLSPEQLQTLLDQAESKKSAA